MTCVALHRLEVTVRLQKLVGGTEVPQTVEHDLFKLWMLGSPQAVPLCQQLRRDGQAVREPEQLPAVAVLLWGALLVLFELFKSCLKFLFQRLGHIQDAVGLLGFGLFQDEGGLAALTPVRKGVVDLLGVELFQSVLVGSLHGLADRDGTTPIGGIEISSTVMVSGTRNVPSSSSFSTVIFRSCASLLVLKLSHPSQGLPKWSLYL